jgi:hypothetical protein
MILNRFLTYLSIALLVVSCYKFKEPKKPDNLISKSDMVDILIDSKILGSANMANKRVMEKHGVDIDTYLFKKHNIDSLQFALSNAYYTFHIEEYSEIYTQVEDSLKALKIFYEELEKKEEAEARAKRKLDSLEVITTIKDSISNLKLSDSIKSHLEKEVLQDSVLLKAKFEKFLKSDKLKNDIDDASKEIKRVERKDIPNNLKSKIAKPISDKDLPFRE